MPHEPNHTDLTGCLGAKIIVIATLTVFAPELLVLLAAVIRFSFFSR